MKHSEPVFCSTTTSSLLQKLTLQTPVDLIVRPLWRAFSSLQQLILIKIMAQLAGKLLAKKNKKKNGVMLIVKSNVLIQCQASNLRSSPQTFISPPRAIRWH